MTGRKPIEKRLMNIEQGISDIKDKLCEIVPYESQDDDVDEGEAE